MILSPFDGRGHADRCDEGSWLLNEVLECAKADAEDSRSILLREEKSKFLRTNVYGAMRQEFLISCYGHKSPLACMRSIASIANARAGVRFRPGLRDRRVSSDHENRPRPHSFLREQVANLQTEGSST